MVDKDFLTLLKDTYPNERAVVSEIINLHSILNLPKGTEHFISDIHGEYDAFRHILNNCSGVIREKVSLLFSERYEEAELSSICTLIYYPKEKLNMLKLDGVVDNIWYRTTLLDLIDLAKMLSSKYTRSYVRKALPIEYSYIIDELMHAQVDEDNNQQVYHSKIIDSIIYTKSADEFVVAICELIKRLAVDHIHIVGDIFDRGAHADRVMNVLMNYHSLDITWGNHDILWMGAYAGSLASIAAVLRINIAHNNLSILESGYGISLRELSLFAERTYKQDDGFSPIEKAISVMLFKLEGQLVLRHPEYNMADRLMLDFIDYEKGEIALEGKTYKLKSVDFPTVDKANPYQLTVEEETILRHLKKAFVNSKQLARHVDFLYEVGSVYCIYNNNLIYHGCIPMNSKGELDSITFDGVLYKGREYLDYCDRSARRSNKDLDFMWYLWCGSKSPLAGRTIKTFERMYINDESAGIEDKNPYYHFYKKEEICKMLLAEFGLTSSLSHIINGHTPVIVSKGENPVKANGKLLVIDGGFCKAYQKKTGIAGYTLICNSHGLKIKAHRPFENVDKVIHDNGDINSISTTIEEFARRLMIADTDQGQLIRIKLSYLELLLAEYRNGRYKA